MKAHTDKTRPAASRRRALRAILGAAAAAVPLTTAMLWPAGPAAAQANPLGSNANYTLINACRPIDGLTVSLRVSQDMMSLVTGGYFNVDVPNGGFALQLNGAPPSGTGFQWLQFGIIVEQGQALGFTQYWNPAGIDEHNQPVIVDLPSDMIAAGSILTIQLGNDGSGNVDSITYGVTDPTGRRTSLAMPLPDYSNASYPNNGQPVLIPIEAFQVNLIGPINIENSMFYSGAGYLSYQVSSGSLTVQQSAGQCPEVYEAWEQAGTGETSNALYGLVTPGAASTLVQPVTTAFGGALASNMDTVDDEVQVYHLAGGGASRTVQLDASLFNGGWTGADVNANAAVPVAALGSPIAAYENTIYGAPEAFYLVPNAQGGEQVEELWGKTWSPTSLTNSAHAQPAAVGSGLSGFIDTLAGTDNVFYQGTDQHVHVLTWSPGAPWAEDTRIAASGAPAAAFAANLTGHMNAQSEEVFYVGADQHVYELWRWSRSFDGWHLTDVTLANGAKTLAAVGSSLVGFYDAKAGTDAVFYEGTDLHVHEVLSSASGWTGIDLTAATNAPAVAGGGSLAAHLNTIAGSEEVFVVNANQTVEEMWTWSTATPGWHATNLFAGAAADATPASPGSPLATDINSVSSGKTDELYYIGTDGQIHQLWWSSANGQWYPFTL